MKTRAPLPDCRINIALIQFIPLTQFVDVLDPPFSDIASSIISCLVVRIFMPKYSIVTKFCHLALGDLVIMPHRVVQQSSPDGSTICQGHKTEIQNGCPARLMSLYVETLLFPFCFFAVAYLRLYLKPIHYRIHLGHVRAFPLRACAVKPARSRDALHLIAAPTWRTELAISSHYILWVTESSAILWTIRRIGNRIRETQLKATKWGLRSQKKNSGSMSVKTSK